MGDSLHLIDIRIKQVLSNSVVHRDGASNRPIFLIKNKESNTIEVSIDYSTEYITSGAPVSEQDAGRHRCSHVT